MRLGGAIPEIDRAEQQVACREMPDHPFVLLW